MASAIKGHNFTGVAMTTKQRTLHDEFTAATRVRANALDNLMAKDSPEHRRALDAARAEVDAVLDEWLESKG